jgi:type VI secretion system protein ImpL
MSIRRVLGFMLLFLFFEAVVAVTTLVFFENTNVLLACAAMTGLALGVWVVVVLISRLLSRLGSPKAQSSQKEFIPATPKALAVDDGFAAECAAIIAEANRRLQTLSLQGRQNAPNLLATLPLYLVVGPEGSGKTAAVVNSGLEPRLLAGEAIKDGNTLPTKIANIWLVDKAIFAEISGKVFSQEPERFERTLRMLLEQRRPSFFRRVLYGDQRRPNLKAVIITTDADSLLDKGNLRGLSSLARTFNERLQTIHSVARKDLPVYVLFTKSDSFSYFQEFFAHLSESEGRQVLGVTLPLTRPGDETSDTYVEREGKRLATFLSRLNQSIADKRLVFLAREDVVRNRALAYEFPREFKKAKGEIVQFLLDVFRPATLNEGCRLRGFYFAGRQLVAKHNLAIDATDIKTTWGKRSIDATVLFRSDYPPANSSRTLITSYDPRTAKWTFLSGLFRDVILADPAGRVEAAFVPNQLGRGIVAALGALGVLALILSVIWVNSWRKNRELLNQAQAILDRDGTAQTQTDYLAELDTIRPQLQTLLSFDRGQPPLSYRWGLYSGSGAAEVLRTLYFVRFRQAILQPGMDAMTQLFLSLEPKSVVSNDVYKLLKSYVTITSGACSPDERVISPAVYQMWETVASPAPSDHGVAEKQIAFYSSELKVSDPYGHSISANPDVVARARSYLLDLTGPDKILQALLRDVTRDKSPERLSDYASNYGLVISGPNELPADYTRDSWVQVQDSIREHKLASSGEPCVIGINSGSARVSADQQMGSQVQKLYFDTYKRQWKDYLSAHHVIPFSDTLDGAQKLRTLADNNRSPLLALVYMVSANTNVTVEESTAERVKDKLKSSASGTKQKLAAFVDQFGHSSKGTAPQEAPAAPKAPRDTIYAQFEPVRVMVDPQDRDKLLNEKNQAYMKGLEDLSNAMTSLPPQVHTDAAAEMQALQQAKSALDGANSALHTLSGLFPSTSEGIDVDLANLLREPIDFAGNAIKNVALITPAPTPPPAPVTATPPTVPAPVPAPVPLPTTPPPPDMRPVRLKAMIARVNQSALNLCAVTGALQQKFPFDATAPQDVTVEELNQTLAPGTGSYSQFSASTDVAKTFVHQGRTWAGKPEFQATYSPLFLNTLNNLGDIEEVLYGEGNSSPHFDYTVSVDGTGKIPFELDIDGHTIKFQPGKVTPPVKLIWPPVTNLPTQLKVIAKNGQFTERKGPWGFVHLLQDADEHNGNVFTFRTVQFAHGLNPLKSDKGVAGTIQIRIDSPAINIFTRGYYSKLRCADSWALQPQSSDE